MCNRDISTENAIPQKRVSCLGPTGSFSDRAAHIMRPDCEVVCCKSFREAIRKLLNCEVEGCILPIENSLNGRILECLDLIEHEDVFCTAELALYVDHRLALLEGVRPEDVRTIYSHEQAFAQCDGYLSKYFPHVQYVRTTSTAESLEKLGPHAAGIVGAHIRRGGVVLSNSNIADYKDNFTHFMHIERRGKLPDKSNMVFFSAVCEDRSGSLCGLLTILFNHGLNLTRVESRPVKGQVGQYRFFIELVGDIASSEVRDALTEAENYCKQFKLLGAYN